MNTSAIRSGMLTRTLALLLAASPLACLGVAPSDGEAPLSTTETEAARLAGDGDGYGDALADSDKGARKTHDNSAPCGDRTMAVVHDRSGSTYFFCAFADGTTGVLEDLPAGAAPEASRLDEFQTAAGLLRALDPEGATLPDGLVAAVEAGAVPEGHRSLFPVVVGTARAPVAALANPACSNAQTFSDTYGFSSYVAFMEEFVADINDCSLHVWYTDSYPLVTSHQRTASTNPVFEDYGPPYGTACGAKEHVLSCGGSTLFEALRQENPGDPWVTTLSHWVGDGVVSTWKMYASDCNASNDRDDMRFKGNSEPGVTHRYSTIFNKWFGGGFCDFN